MNKFEKYWVEMAWVLGPDDILECGSWFSWLCVNERGYINELFAGRDDFSNGLEEQLYDKWIVDKNRDPVFRKKVLDLHSLYVKQRNKTLDWYKYPGAALRICRLNMRIVSYKDMIMGNCDDTFTQPIGKVIHWGLSCCKVYDASKYGLRRYDCDNWIFELPQTTQSITVNEIRSSIPVELALLQESKWLVCLIE